MAFQEADVVYLSDNFLVVNKPANLLMFVVLFHFSLSA